jgi:hypothetical protein
MFVGLITVDIWSCEHSTQYFNDLLIEPHVEARFNVQFLYIMLRFIFEFQYIGEQKLTIIIK